MLWSHGWTTLICLSTPHGIGRVGFREKGCCLVEGVLVVESWVDDTHFINSLWDWGSELQRERMLSSSGSACCGIMGGRHSFLTTPYGIGRVDFRGKGCCLVEGVLVVESWLDDTYLFNNSVWDWESELQRERMLSSRGSACCGVMDGRHSCFGTL